MTDLEKINAVDWEGLERKAVESLRALKKLSENAVFNHAGRPVESMICERIVRDLTVLEVFCARVEPLVNEALEGKSCHL